MHQQHIYEIKDIMQIMKISRNTAYKLIRQELIPHIRVGNRYKIPAAAFKKWIFTNAIGEVNGTPVICGNLSIMEGEFLL